jgi:hypothetical protein
MKGKSRPPPAARSVSSALRTIEGPAHGFPVCFPMGIRDATLAYAALLVVGPRLFELLRPRLVGSDAGIVGADLLVRLFYVPVISGNFVRMIL